MPFTHYAYLSGPHKMREPVLLLDYTHKTVGARRMDIHDLLDSGLLVAKLPTDLEVETIDDLKAALYDIDERR